MNKKAYVHIENWHNRHLYGGEYENVTIHVSIAVNGEVLDAAEGMKEDKTGWVSSFQWLRGHGLDEVKHKRLGMLEALGEVFPETKYQRYTIHFYRNVFSVPSKAKLVTKMLKAIHAQESKKAAREKAKAALKELKMMKLKEAAKNVIERLNREIQCRTHVVETFPDGNFALMLVCARLRHFAVTQWDNKKYMNMKLLETTFGDVSIAC